MADLARLLKRYPSADWNNLARWLQDDSKRGQVESILEELSRIRPSRAAPAGSRVERKVGLNRILDELRQSDPPKATLLARLRARLMSREMLATPGDLRAFADAVGFELSSSIRKRDQAVNDLVRHLANYPYDELVRAIETAPRTARNLGLEYERWVGLILGTRSQEP